MSTQPTTIFFGFKCRFLWQNSRNLMSQIKKLKISIKSCVFLLSDAVCDNGDIICKKQTININHCHLHYHCILIDLRTILFSVMTKQCEVCKKWFHRLVQHLRVSKWISDQLNEVAKVPKNIFMPPQGSNVNEIIKWCSCSKS